MKEPGFFSDSLPEGVPAELTVSELEEMACRQQQQIESQRQLLAAKEQRLRFLKQHEAKHQLVASEHERLRRLRDKVETQEQKLRKLRALRGQVDQTKLNNVSLTSDLESIRSLFNEKEKELSIAVAKVEELTRQLEELQRGRDINSSQKGPSAAAGELEKLRAELMYRNKLNEQHSARLTHQRELLAQRQEEMAAIDRRIAELQERLHRKRLLNQQLAHQINKQQSQDNNNQKIQMQQQQQQQPQPQQQHYPQIVNQQNQILHHSKPSQPLTQMQQKINQQKFQQMLHLQKQQQQQQQQHLQQLHPQQMQHQIQQSQPMLNHNINVTNKSLQQMKNSSPQGVNVIPKPPMNKTSAGINIAAVEPYHHVPSAKSCHNQYGGPIVQQELKPPHRVHGPANGVMNAPVGGGGAILYQQPPRPDQRSHYPYPMIQQNQKDPRVHSSDDHRVPVCGSVATEEDKKLNHETSSSSEQKLEDRLHEFWPNKFDPKYQTLPSGTKFSPVTNNVGRYDCRRPAEGIETTFSGNHEAVGNQSKYTSNDKGIADDGPDTNGSSSNNMIYGANVDNVRSAGGANANQQQQMFVQQMNIVRSMPIQNNPNKGLATALSNSNQTPKNADNANRSYEVASFSSHNHVENQSSFPAPAVPTSSTSVTFSNTYQKPVSSVSPIYQTSSTRIQPVQPQVIGSIAVSQQQQQQQLYHDSRRTYQVNPDSSTNAYQTVNCNGNAANSNNIISKPALPPKPAAPVKITPPPPPRQSAFHVQFAALCENKCPAETRPVTYDYERETVDENLNHEVQSRLTGLDLKDNNKSEKKFYGKDTIDADMIDTNSSTIRAMTNMNVRNGLVFNNKDLPPKMVAESPPPLPSVDPPSDDEIEKSMKMKTIYVQKSTDNDESGANNIDCGNNDSEGKDRSHHVQAIMSDMSQDSSSSDTSSAENNYIVNTSRRIELPPSYLFPEGGQSNEKDVNIILNMKNTIEQINVDTSSETEKSSTTSLSPDSENSEKLNEETQLNDDIKKLKKGNLKNNNSVNSKRRVSFDPLALLLDASLEGELELVIRTAGQVKNPSSANDEGITALHNAICAGHFEIVRFLVQFGCDVNAQDSDGWTPLHCAASCNNLPMVRFLVEHGACIFATTLSDQETAAEKCEEDEEGFDGCSEFLYSVQEKLGILNTGVVYAVFDYEAHNPDELSFKEGDRLTVLRKGDEWEREWWWSRHNDKEGYVPRNLLGLYPRTHPNTNRIQD